MSSFSCRLMGEREEDSTTRKVRNYVNVGNKFQTQQYARFGFPNAMV